MRIKYQQTKLTQSKLKGTRGVRITREITPRITLCLTWTTRNNRIKSTLPQMMISLINLKSVKRWIKWVFPEISKMETITKMCLVIQIMKCSKIPKSYLLQSRKRASRNRWHIENLWNFKTIKPWKKTKISMQIISFRCSNREKKALIKLIIWSASQSYCSPGKCWSTLKNICHLLNLREWSLLRCMVVQQKISRWLESPVWSSQAKILYEKCVTT